MKFGLTCQFGWKIYYGKFFFGGIELGGKWISVGCGDVDLNDEFSVSFLEGGRFEN